MEKLKRPNRIFVFVLLFCSLLLVACDLEELEWSAATGTQEGIEKHKSKGEITDIRCSTDGKKDSMVVIEGNRSFSISDKVCDRLTIGAEVNITYNDKLKAIEILYLDSEKVKEEG